MIDVMFELPKIEGTYEAEDGGSHPRLDSEA